jgi:hypothetical protein
MKTYIILWILFTFSSFAVSAGLHVLNIVKFIAGIYQKLPHSCMFIMNSEAEQQGENNCDLISYEGRVLEKNYLHPAEKMCLDFAISDAESSIGNDFGRQNIPVICGNVNCFDFEEFQLCSQLLLQIFSN